MDRFKTSVTEKETTMTSASQSQLVRICRSTLTYLALLLMLITGVRAQDFTYATNNGAITITRYTGPGGAVNIPGTITGLPVISIGGSAFTDCTNLTSVKIPDSVINIEDGGAPQGGAFGFCPHLTDVTGGSSVTNIGAFAFVFCARLSTVTMGQNLVRIGAEAFRQCGSLTGISLPESVASLEEGAFWACSSLTNATLGNSLTNIGDNAFWVCPGLTNLTIPASVVGIGQGAFGYCANLTAINVNPVNNAFSSLDGVLFNKTHTTLMACPAAIGRNYEMPEGVNRIEGSAFAGCGSLTNISIPNSVTAIGNYAFYGCTSLPSAVIGNGLTRISSGAFGDCTGLTSIYFQGNAPTTMGDVFSGSDNATVYYLPGTAGWGPTFADGSTALWTHPVILEGSLVMEGNALGFTIAWAPDVTVVVEASATLPARTWLPISTNVLTGGVSVFSDPEPATQPTRFYRLRSP